MSETQTRTRKKRVAPLIVVSQLAPLPAKIGAPSSYTPERANEICTRLTNGELLINICRDKHMPNTDTIYAWREKHPDFAEKYARARELQAHCIAERAINIAMEATQETAQVDRLKFDAFRWYASKVSPRNYGDKVQTELSGPNGGPLQIAAQVIDARSMTAEARAALREALRASLPAPAGRIVDVEPEE